MICIGSCVAASGVPKIFGDRGYEKYRHQNYEEEGEYVGRRRRSMMASGENEEEMVDPKYL